MKYLLILVTCLISLGHSGSNKLDVKYGFRDMIFESNFDQSNGSFTLVEDDGDSKYYIRESDDMYIGDAKVKSIIYGFYKNQFANIIIKSSNYVNFTVIKETFSCAYGNNPYKDNEYIEDYSWFGNKTYLKIKYSEITEIVTIFMTSKPMRDKENNDNSKKAKEASKGL